MLGGMILCALLMPNLTACLFPLFHAPYCPQPRVPEATLESGAQAQLHGPGERQLNPAAGPGMLPAATCHHTCTYGRWVCCSVGPPKRLCVMQRSPPRRPSFLLACIVAIPFHEHPAPTCTYCHPCRFYHAFWYASGCHPPKCTCLLQKVHHPSLAHCSSRATSGWPQECQSRLNGWAVMNWASTSGTACIHTPVQAISLISPAGAAAARCATAGGGAGPCAQCKPSSECSAAS